MTKGRRLILYFTPETLLGASFLKKQKGKPVRIGTMDIGKVVEIREDGTEIGLVIEWGNDFEVATLL